LWDTLTSEDHALLCELPAPHGPLFTWLDSQWHEHGPLPWEALRESLGGGPSDDGSSELATRVMSGASMPSEPLSESGPELRDLLNRMLIDRLKELETQAIEDSRADPTALQRYRELQLRRRQLEKAQSDGIIQS
jgi:DNA primase